MRFSHVNYSTEVVQREFFVIVFFDIFNNRHAVRRTGEALRVLHVHDNNGISDLHRMPFYGIIDWEDFNEALKDIRYSGVFSLEAGPAKRLPAEIFDDVAKIMYKCALKILDKGGK